MAGDIVTLSLSARILVNVEALNMAESVGNVTRHRRAPIAVSSGGKYSIVYVPAVSGESIAHHYQRLLADIAASMGLSVTEMDRRGYFLKFADSKIINTWYPEVKNVTGDQDLCRVEETLVRASTVADVAGFLFTDKLVRRTSRVRFSYLIPSLDAVSSGAAASYPQLHVRYAPPEAFQTEQQREQALYYVESGSALYTLSSVFAASDVARLEYCKNKAELENEKLRRVEAALKALTALMDGLSFGAKRSRYLPVWDVRSMIVSVSKGPVEFVVSPGSDKEYIEKTLKRASAISEKLGVTIKIYVYDGEGLGISDVSDVEVERCETHTETLAKASSQVLEMLKAKS
ncbi:MAG: type I-A CRISPR-associated protein Cas7/Csa2 [Thermoprotei archaeon]|nr:type I-A CRISPR-associated protein Cas7/Csa2 [Thermoprotei archaeon]